MLTVSSRTGTPSPLVNTHFSLGDGGPVLETVGDTEARFFVMGATRMKKQ